MLKAALGRLMRAMLVTAIKEEGRRLHLLLYELIQ
jgi:hypothetical protein